MKRSLNFAMIGTIMTMAILVIGVGLAVELTAQSAFAMTMMPGNQTNGKMMSGNVTSGMMKGNESGGKMMSGNVTSGMMKGNETGGMMNGNQTTPPMLPKK
jgi:hypothetical protein